MWSISDIPTAIMDEEIIQSAISFLQTGVFSHIKGNFRERERERRKTWEYGYTYPDLMSGKHNYKGLPRQLLNVYERAASQLMQTIDTPLPAMCDITNCIISSYGPGYFLGDHCDEDWARSRSGKGNNSFYFGEVIVGIILQAD